MSLTICQIKRVHRLLALAWLFPACWACDLSRLAPIPTEPQTLDALIAKGQFRGALTLLKPQLEQKPDDARLNWLTARALAAVGDLDDALPLAEKALAADPQSAPYHVTVAAVYGMQAQRASLFKQLGLAKHAKKELDAAYALDPKNPDALYGLMLFDYAAPAMLGGDKAKAQQMGEAIVALDPVRGYASEAALAHEQKDAAAEEELLRKALAGHSDFTNTEVYAAAATLAELYRSQNKLGAAEELGCAMLQQEPSRIDAYRVLVSIAVRDQCWNEAEDLIAMSTTRVPNDFSAYFAAADEMTRTGHHAATAERMLRVYISKPVEANTPSLAMAHAQLAAVLEKQGRTPEAITELEQALAQDATLEAARKDLKRLKKPS